MKIRNQTRRHETGRQRCKSNTCSVFRSGPKQLFYVPHATAHTAAHMRQPLGPFPSVPPPQDAYSTIGHQREVCQAAAHLRIIAELLGRRAELRLGLLTVAAPGRVEHDQHVLLLLEERLERVVGEVVHVGRLLGPGRLGRRRRRRLLRVLHELEDLVLVAHVQVERHLAVPEVLHRRVALDVVPAAYHLPTRNTGYRELVKSCKMTLVSDIIEYRDTE